MSVQQKVRPNTTNRSKPQKVGAALFVKIPRTWVQETLRSHFGRIGPLTKVHILANKSGIGFVTFNNHTDGDNAIAHFNEREMDGTILTVAWSDTLKSKIKELFQDLESKKLGEIQLDREAEYSVSSQTKADQLTNIIRAWIPDAKSITDGCACVGGNTISFAKQFLVNACELDPVRFGMLLNNLKVYQLEHKCTLLNEDFNLFLGRIRKPDTTISQDIIFLDPPWGGKNYKTLDQVSLFLGKTNIWDVVRSIHDYKLARLTVLKVPNTFQWQGFESSFTSCAQSAWPCIAKVIAADWGYVFIDHQLLMNKEQDMLLFEERLMHIPSRGHIRYCWYDQVWHRVDDKAEKVAIVQEQSAAPTSLSLSLSS